MIQVEQIERRVLADRQALITAHLVRGADAKDLPTLAEAQAEFDDYLASEPASVTVIDTEQMRLRRALGVA